MEIDPRIYTGRPDERRIAKEERCYQLLDSLGMSYQRADHEPADTIQDCHQVEELLGCRICKNLLLTDRRQTELYLLLMPGDKPFKTKILSKQIGSSRLSFASPRQMEESLDISPGSLSILGLMNDKENRVHLLIDKEVLDQPCLGCHPCINTSSLRLDMAELKEKLLPALGHQPVYVELPWDTEE